MTRALAQLHVCDENIPRQVDSDPCVPLRCLRRYDFPGHRWPTGHWPRWHQAHKANLRLVKAPLHLPHGLGRCDFIRRHACYKGAPVHHPSHTPRLTRRLAIYSAAAAGTNASCLGHGCGFCAADWLPAAVMGPLPTSRSPSPAGSSSCRCCSRVGQVRLARVCDRVPLHARALASSLLLMPPPPPTPLSPTPSRRCRGARRGWCRAAGVGSCACGHSPRWWARQWRGKRRAACARRYAERSVQRQSHAGPPRAAGEASARVWRSGTGSCAARRGAARRDFAAMRCGSTERRGVG